MGLCLFPGCLRRRIWRICSHIRVVVREHVFTIAQLNETSCGFTNTHVLQLQPTPKTLYEHDPFVYQCSHTASITQSSLQPCSCSNCLAHKCMYMPEDSQKVVLVMFNPNFHFRFVLQCQPYKQQGLSCWLHFNVFLYRRLFSVISACRRSFVYMDVCGHCPSLYASVCW